VCIDIVPSLPTPDKTTCLVKNLPTKNAPAQVSHVIGKTSPRPAWLYCRKRRCIRLPDGRRSFVPCGRPKCSQECRKRWARKQSACLLESHKHLPPTHEMRLSVLVDVPDVELTKSVRRFTRRLGYRLKQDGYKFAYLIVNEWARLSSHRHVHMTVRTDADLDLGTVREMWRKSTPGRPASCHMAPIETVIGWTRYTVKDQRNDYPLVPDNFCGRIVLMSRNYLARPMPDIWRELRAKWYEPHQPNT
jgi:hypothetical protein